MDRRVENLGIRNDPSTGPLRWLYACAVLLVVLLVIGDAAILVNLRDNVLRSRAVHLGNISLTLAEQANRSMQGLDLVLASLSDLLARDGVVDSASYRQKMSGYDTHVLLAEKLTGLPYINAVTMIDADGNLINFSRYWPIPKINVADRDYFRALATNPAISSFVSQPVQNRGDGRWTVYLARRVRGADGGFAGLLLGAIELRYFEDLYRSVQLDPGSAISLMRDDSVLLARYPRTQTIGDQFGETVAPLPDDLLPVITRAISPVDGQMRTKAARRLPDFPMFVLVTQTLAASLQGWSDVAWTLALITIACVISIATATAATARGWRHQREVGLERAERAEVERARAQTEADLSRERERHAHEASRAKSSFLAMMSHEIRTPMNAVLGLAATLLEEALPPRQRHAVEAIRDSGDSLLRILNDILDFSKLDAGRMTLEDMPFSPATLTHNIISILGPRASAKGLAIAATCEPTLPAILLGDAGRIRQILLNLVSNAVKFTSHGTVAIKALCPDRDDGTACIEWVVSDTGIGIAPDRIRSLFGEFVQMDDSIHRRFGGSGLGLAICKRLADQMGGSISVTSSPGVGTTFHFRLSLPLSDRAADDPQPAADFAARFHDLRGRLGRQPRILFAEDNATNQYVALQLLKGIDIQIDVVGDGLEAVDAASNFIYDAIFMDVRMPEMDGLSATRLIRRRGGDLARIPIIALTANAFPEDVQACFAAGMDRFLPKPVTRDMLLSALVISLSARNSSDDVTPGGSGPPAPANGLADVPSLDDAALQEMIDAIGDEGVTEMVQVFERETRDRLARLAGPADAGQTVLAGELHTLKGAAQTVCAPALAALAAAAEANTRQGGSLTAGEHTALMHAFDAWLLAFQATLPEVAATD